jgi:hypothetical protein
MVSRCLDVFEHEAKRAVITTQSPTLLVLCFKSYKIYKSMGTGKEGGQARGVTLPD